MVCCAQRRLLVAKYEERRAAALTASPLVNLDGGALSKISPATCWPAGHCDGRTRGDERRVDARDQSHADRATIGKSIAATDDTFALPRCAPVTAAAASEPIARRQPVARPVPACVWSSLGRSAAKRKRATSVGATHEGDTTNELERGTKRMLS